jgi:CrcB protein
MRTVLAIAAAGALGAVSRHYVDGLLNRHTSGDFPWGIFVVNVSGSFALGALVGLFAHRLGIPMWLQAAATVGFLGAFTTFSTYMLQIYRSASTGHVAIALANAFGSLAAGLLALYAGDRFDARAVGTIREWSHCAASCSSPHRRCSTRTSAGRSFSSPSTPRRARPDSC